MFFLIKCNSHFNPSIGDCFGDKDPYQKLKGVGFMKHIYGLRLLGLCFQFLTKPEAFV